MTATEHTCDSPVDFRGGVMSGLGAAIGYIAAISPDGYGDDHAVAVTVALRDVSSRLSQDLVTMRDGGDPTWLRH